MDGPGPVCNGEMVSSLSKPRNGDAEKVEADEMDHGFTSFSFPEPEEDDYPDGGIDKQTFDDARNTPVNDDASTYSSPRHETVDTEMTFTDKIADYSSLGPQRSFESNFTETNDTPKAKTSKGCVGEDTVLTDVESFDGKIVYNPDGSAFIIEGDTDLSDTESILDLPQHSIIEHKDKVITSHVPVYPQIDNAFYVHRNPNMLCSNMFFYSGHKPKPEAPIMHSYKVFDLRTRRPSSPKDTQKSLPEFAKKFVEAQTVPTKPILMCFICKLSFGFPKSFVAHALSEHNMTLQQEENQIMSQKNTSAIIQALGKEREPLLSFLKPNITSEDLSPESAIPIPHTSDFFRVSSGSNTSVSYVYNSVKTSPVESNSNTEPSEPSSAKGTSRSSAKPLEGTSFDFSGFKNNNNNSIELKARSSSSEETPVISRPRSNSPRVEEYHPLPSQMSLVSFGMMPPTCDEHPQGKVHGVECPKCDMVLGSSRSLGGHMTMMHSRNSCKTLKCPKCNWHYKYQETLEIHMKEKHPENDSQCIYCLTNQPHPRLARGETYTCGYKPYRCDVCNYSTTTKGNLSIHMQSDKHINNVQDIQNGGGEMKIQHVAAPPPSPTDLNGAKKALKPKPTWRCDVCNYETNVARNLRIHMTSEKHTHNMMVLQHNVKHMQRDMQMQLNQMALFGPQESPMLALPSHLTPPGMPPFPFDQSLFMPVPPGPVESPIDLTKALDQAQSQYTEGSSEPSKLFQCSVCNVNSSDSIDSLHQHMQIDRSKNKPDDSVIITQGQYLCQLCSYKTNLKANFQLHCKTDKHIQRLQLVNHVREGGPANEWRLKYFNMSNPIQVKCNACDYYTNSIHKLQIHTTNPRHETSAQLFQQLLRKEASLKAEKTYFHCTWCNFSTTTKLNLIQHSRTMKHLRCESSRQVYLQEKGSQTSEDEEVFSVRAYTDEDDIEFEDGDGEQPEEESTSGEHVTKDNNNQTENQSTDINTSGQDEQSQICPYCNYSCDNDVRMHAHIISAHTQNPREYLCPLCQDNLKERHRLEKHLVQTHNVASDALQRLMTMLDMGRVQNATSLNSQDSQTPLNTATRPDTPCDDNQSEVSETEAIRLANDDDAAIIADKEDVDSTYRCQMCTATFQTIDLLYSHQNTLGHLELKQTPRGPGYLCWKKGCNQYFKTAQALQVHFREIHAKKTVVSVSEKHVYKYRCNQCSLAFRTLEKLQLHSQYHVFRAATKCTVCGKSFRAVATLKRHVETTHMDTMSPADIEQFKTTLSNTMNLLQGADGGFLQEEENDVMDLSMDGPTDLSKPSQNDDAMEDLDGDDDNDEELNLALKDTQYFEEHINTRAVAEDSYQDPKRKFKCHRCKVAFVQQVYLTAHNRTPMHRKNEKNVSYTMEKFMDPNRPYKCDICKESFTQKNILLVHYNSVSHLHKVRQVQSSPAISSSAESPAPAHSSIDATPAIFSSVSSSSTTTTSSNENKPYKCNICKVAYSQGSTLDIHIRSVLHQTRASKLQELAMTGQVDVNLPLIEQPDHPKAAEQASTHRRILADMLIHKQPPISTVMTNGHPVFFTTAVTPSTPVSNSNQSALSPGGKPIYSCNKCNAIFMNQEALFSHPCFQQAQLNFPTNMPPAVFQQMMKRNSFQRTKPQVHRNLLENFGFECVMQYNEFMQKIRSEDDKAKDEEKAKEKREKEETKEIKKEVDDMPEMNRAKCPKCKKEFSSIWVLKAHQEEIHRDFVPLDFVEDCGVKIKDDLQKKTEVENANDNSQDATTSGTPLPTPTPSTSSEITIKTEPTSIAEQIHNHNQMSMMMPMTLGMPLAMAMQPPLMPVMIPTSENMPFPSPTLPNVVEANMMAAQRMQQHQQQQQNQQTQSQHHLNQKRARTRINDEQLKILRGYFDINNSPTEEQIQVMSDQSGLPQKVIKHWFRNTLFKERQRNKDSPYNFNNPPSTTLNLEEYEKTGKIEVEQVPEEARKNDSDSNAETGSVISANEVVVKNELLESPPETPQPEPMEIFKPLIESTPKRQPAIIPDSLPQLSSIKVEPTVNMPPIPIMPPLVLTPIITSPRLSLSPGVSSGLTSYTPNSSFATSPIPMMRPEGNQYSPTPSSMSSMAMSRRANRTRFTDYQIKILQEYFEQNAYPKDDDLEHMSKILNLSPRVIVVWFQNARQKARKVYENQPPTEGDESENSRFQRTPGSNYQCKKCLTVFQRYYELIKHQKKHCFKDEDIPPCQVFGDDVMSNSSSYLKEINEADLGDSDNDMDDKSIASSTSPSTSRDSELFKCDKCNLSFSRFEAWREHQAIHALNQPMFPSFPAESAFGLLQNIAQQQQQRQQAQLLMNRDLEKAGNKRKIEEEDLLMDKDEQGQPRDKRLRTTILPEQLDYLYQKYQLDCNPSRKQLETIAHDVGLKKRVVQVWFQNTRARERKGQYRAHQQLIHKRCPFCRALFRAKSALESHLATKHPEEMAKGDINIDNIPDAAPESPSSTPVSSSPGIDLSKMMSNPFAMNPFMPMIPPGFAGGNDPMQLQMKRFYEDSIKKYVEECNKQGAAGKGDFSSKSSTQSKGDDAPLDLSKPLKIKLEHSEDDDHEMGEDMSRNSFSDSESYSDFDDSMHNPNSPNGLHRSPGGTPKRFRTQMTSIQIRIMKNIYLEYKTPTMAECESLGRDIGLPKRVIQVWFQNARAKEKKAKFGYGKPYIDELPVQHNEECKLCDFKYTHKYSVQDHIFTKSHLENMKKSVQSQLDSEQVAADAVTLVRQREMEKAQQRGSSEKTESGPATLSHANLAQLQAMGMPVSAAMGIPNFLGGLPPGVFPGFMPPELAAKFAKEGTKVKDELKDGEKTTDKNDNNSKWPFENAMTPNIMGPIFPGMESAGMLPFMYPGMPGLYPGMGLPLMQPGYLPGMENFGMGYDLASFGTPLPLLQIPPQVIREVMSKITEQDAKKVQYTQDCKAVADLKSMVNASNMAIAAEATLDVGYICKKCHMVYPQRDGVYTHQRMVCFPGKNPSELGMVVKIEQIQYQCSLCMERMSTAEDFKQHCETSMHKTKMASYAFPAEIAASSKMETSSC